MLITRLGRLIALAGAGAILCGAGAAEPVPAAPHAGGDVLDASCQVRFFMVGEPDKIKLSSGELQAVVVGHADKMGKVKDRRSALPPADWIKPEFDDVYWPEQKSPIDTSDHREVSLLCVRARFLVEDPSKAAGLELSLGYRGGMVIYLNGKEIGRGHMPAGEVKPETPAESYPKEAFVNPEGFLLRHYNGGFGDPGRYPDRFKMRERVLEKIKLPADALRKGTNVLALEFHRPLTDAIFYECGVKEGNKEYGQWSTLRLGDLKLTAPAGASASGRVAMGGLRVWNRQTAKWVRADEPCPVGESLRPVVVRGARNGAFSAQVVAGGDTPIRGLKVEVSDLKGPGVLPGASCVQVRYGIPDGPEMGKAATFDGLELFAPAEVPVGKSGSAIQPVWITVHVPRDAKPGDYEGKLTVRADGANPVETTLKISVADWTVPDAKDSESYYWLVQSPEVLALKYNVPMWSDKHWEMIGKSFELMGQVGTRIVYIPMFCQAYQGNEFTMVRWIKKGDSWDYDVSLFDKYIDLAVKKLGKLDIVCLQCWPISTGGTYFGGGADAALTPIKFTVLDPATGKMEMVDGPSWGQPESRVFWTGVLGVVREHLAKRGLAAAMMVGIGHDRVPPKECVEDLKAAAPEAKWVVHCHPKQWTVRGVPTGYLGNVWGMPSASFPEDGHAYGWKETKFWTTFPRYGSGTIDTLRNGSPLAQYRLSLEGAACAGLKGYGWIGADFWPVPFGKDGKVVSLLDYHTYDRRTNLGIAHSVTAMLAPGRDGPLATVRLEAARQNLQEVEARVFLERILLDPARRAKLGEDLAGRCQTLLDDRQRAIPWGKINWDLALCADLDKLSAGLYALAAEATVKMGGK
ncbi:MAG: glycoside hydrolase domain-containing protein [Planctomycetota bacterium]